jgi:hypothetical protein
MLIAILLYVACSAIAHWISFGQVSKYEFGDYTLPISILVLLLALIWWLLQRLRKSMALRAIDPNS